MCNIAKHLRGDFAMVEDMQYCRPSIADLLHRRRSAMLQFFHWMVYNCRFSRIDSKSSGDGLQGGRGLQYNTDGNKVWQKYFQQKGHSQGHKVIDLDVFKRASFVENLYQICCILRFKSFCEY